MVFEPNPEQTRLLGYAIFLIPLVVQGLRWIFSNLLKQPLDESGIKIVVVICAIGFALLWNFPVFAAFPGFVWTVAGVEILLAWVVSLIFVIQGFIATTSLIYEYLWRRLVFDRVEPLAGRNLS